jgi:hypothetical protein
LLPRDRKIQDQDRQRPHQGIVKDLFSVFHGAPSLFSKCLYYKVFFRKSQSNKRTLRKLHVLFLEFLLQFYLTCAIIKKRR